MAPLPGVRPLCGRLPGGCNFLLCRCKHAFCYACGAPYVHTQRTANNAHGQPGCRCNLFDPPPEEAAPERIFNLAAFERMPAAPPPQQHIVSLRKGRAQLRDGRRWVKRINAWGDSTWKLAGPQRCNKSYTHAECPYGVSCWFRHTDDDL